jgi:hypothetical protein
MMEVEGGGGSKAAEDDNINIEESVGDRICEVILWLSVWIASVLLWLGSGVSVRLDEDESLELPFDG